MKTHLVWLASCLFLLAMLGINTAHNAREVARLEKGVLETHALLNDARSELAQCNAGKASVERSLVTLRGAASASQQNCAQTILNTQKLFELALPPQNFAIPPIEGAVEVFAPSSAAPQQTSTVPQQVPSQVNDHAFTNFLNTW